MNQTIKRITTFCMTAVLAVALLPTNAFATQSELSAKGSESNPYEIATADDFARVREHLDAYFVLTKDVDMAGVPMETIKGAFTGTLDGKGYTISNLVIDTIDAALFETIAKEKDGTNIGVVKNIVFDRPTVTGTNNAAVVAGRNYGYVSDIQINGGTVKALKGTAGALVATQIDATGVIQKCGSTAAVSGAVAGGLVGLLEMGTLQTSYAGGTVSGDANAKLGSVFGNCMQPTVTVKDVFYKADPKLGIGMQTKTDAAKSEVYESKGDGAYVGVTSIVPSALKVGDEGTTPFTYTASSKKTAPLSYSSSNPAVLTVDSRGDYKAIAEGKASYIWSIKCGSHTYSVTQAVEVSEASSSTPSSSEASSSVASSSEASSSVASSSEASSSVASSSEASSSEASSSEASSSEASSSVASSSVASSSEASSSEASSSEASSSDISSSVLPEENPEQKPDETPEPSPDEIEYGSWKTENGRRYYTMPDGTKAKGGPIEVDDLYYVFDDEGAAYRYQFFYEGAWYLADDNGALYRNCFLSSSTSRTFYGLDGGAATGWFEGPDGKEYYQRESDTIGVQLATGVFTTPDKGTCLFGKDGVRATGTGWFDGVYVENGTVIGGKRVVDGKTYIFKASGEPYKGEFTYGGTAYCADETGVLYLDAFRKMPDGTLRYYNAEGQLSTGWFDRADGRYYQSNNFVVLTGRQAVGDTIYFFGSDGKLSTADGWAGDYYLRAGEALTDMQEIDGKTYYFGTDGLVVRGVFTDNDAKYCGDETGALYKNAVAYEADGSGAYYDENGKATPGWKTVGTDKYYQLPTLVLATGKQMIENTAFFFTAQGKQLTGDGWAGNYYVKNGKIVTGLQPIDGAQYVFSDEGSVYKNEFTWNNGAYCADATGKLYTDTVRTLTDGTLRYFGKDGKAPVGLIETESGSYYQSKELVLLTGKQTIEDGKVYYFNDAGRMITAGWVGNVYVLDGKPAVGPKTVDGKKYIFSSADPKKDPGGPGIAYKYVFNYEGGRYFASGTGALYTNCFLSSEGKTTYYNADGVAPTEWFALGGGAKYYQTKDYTILTGQQMVDKKLHFFGSDGKLSTKDGWAGDYYVEGGAAIVGMQVREGAQYFFGEDGLLVRGEIVHGEAQYFANDKGVIQKDMVRTLDNGTLRYYDEDGKAVTKGWFGRGGAVDEYYQGSDMVLAVGKKTIDNQIYFFEVDGKRKTTDGWAGDYYVKDGVALTGEQKELDGGPYIFDAEGAVQKGDFVFNGATYYGDPKTGSLLRNAIHATTGGKRYQNADGKAVVGWIELDDATYYQNEQLLLVTGRQVLMDEKGEQGLYYFGSDGKLKTGDGWADGYYLVGGKVLTGPQTIDGVRHVFDDDGLLQKENFQYHGTWYCADENGALVTNAIRTLENKRMRYFGEDGAALPGFHTYLNESYYQNGEAYLVTGRQVIDSKVYFFSADGKQQKGDGWIDGYYLKGGVPETGKKDIDGKTYIFDSNGLVQKGEFVFSTATYWADETGALYKDTVRVRANGTRIYLAENGAAPTGWAESPTGAKYYQAKSGSVYALATGFTVLGADTYYFAASGKLFAGNRSGWYSIDGKQYYLLSDGRYCAPPSIQSVATAHDPNKKLYSITVNSTVSGAAGTHPAGSFSFDGGYTWQASNVLTVADSKGITIGAGKIRVRDAIGQMVQHLQTVYLAPVITIPGGSGASGPGSYGIDVSMYNASINWQAVKASGINFAIIRATSANNNGYYVDPYFESNVRNAKAAGVDVGLYIYSYARSYQDVADEVNFFVNSQQARNLKASGISLDYPVYIDYEDKLNLQGTSYDQRTDFVRQMMVQLRNAGYYSGFYTYKSYSSYFNVKQLVNEGYDFWYARYPANPYPPNNPSGDVGANVSIWQYCSDGNTNPGMKPYVNGVYTSLDLNYVYDDVPSRVHKFYGTGSTQTKPNAPSGVVTPNTLSVYDTNSNKVVTDNAANIVARIVQTEVGGFNNAEVYKAQAIAAHSYLLFQAQRGATPTVSLSSPSGAVTAAVNEVANTIVTYGGVVANTMYGAANSGKTYSPDGMWSGGYPYLVAGIDSPGDLAATQYASSGLSWQNRTNTIKLATMTSNIEKMVPGSTSGRSDYQNWITSPEYDANGYLTYITVMGVRIKAGKFYDNCWGLYSPNFTMTYNNNGTWSFVTRGNGHCVGMSQWGAYGFARQGSGYASILAHYYPGTQLTKLS